MDIATIGFKADTRDLGKAGREFDDLARKGDRAERRIRNSTTSMTKGFGQLKSAIGLVTAAIAAMGGYSAVRQIANFETELNKLQAVSGSTASQMVALEDQARSLGATTTFAANEAAQAQVFLAQAGFKSNEVLKATPGILKLAIAGNLDLARAADIASNVLGGMALQVDDLNRVNDVLAKTAASSNTNIEQLGQALSFAAPFAVSAGISIEQVAAAVGVLSNNGLQATRAGTGVVGVIRQLSRVTPQAEEVLNKYGLTVGDVNIEANGLNNVMQKLAQANLTTGDAIQIFGTEAGAAGQLLASQNEQVKELTTSLENSSGAADKMAETMKQGLAVSAKEFTSALSELNLQVDESFGTSSKLQTGLDTASSAVLKISEAIEKAYGTASAAPEQFQPLYDALIIAAKLANAGYTTISQLAVSAGYLYDVLNTEISSTMFEELGNHTAWAKYQIEQLQAQHLAFIKSLDESSETSATATQQATEQVVRLARVRVEAQKETTKTLTEDQKDLLKSAQDMVEDYGDTWTRTGNKVIDALGSMSAAIAKTSAVEMKYTEKLNELKQAGLDKTEEYQKLETARAKASVKGSMDMMAASVAMYEEGSDAQKAAHNAYLAMSAVELAMNMQRAISAAVVAVANQGTGDPYSAFARIAAMSVMMGGLLSQIGASFTGTTGSAQSSAGFSSVGAGGVLGSNELSTSIANSYERLEEINADQYTELRGIYSEMKDLNNNISGVVSSLYRTGDLEGLGASAGSFSYAGQNVINTLDSLSAGMGDLTEKIFGLIPGTGGIVDFMNGLSSGLTSSLSQGAFGSVSKEIHERGLLLPAFRLGGDVDLKKFMTQVTYRDGGWGRSTRRSERDIISDISGESERMINLVFDNLRNGMIEMGELVGRDVQQQVDNFVISIGKIDVQNKTADQINEAFTHAVSVQSDRLASSLFSDLIYQYAKVNESAFDTVSRLGVDKIIAENILELTNQTFGTTTVTKTLFDRGGQVFSWTETVTADAIAVSQAFVELAGSLENLQDAATSYYDAFFTESEKQARNAEYLTESLAQQNLVLPETREAYRALVESLNLGTEAGRKQYYMLLNLSDVADDYYSNLEKAQEEHLATLAEEQSAYESEALQTRIDLLNEETNTVHNSISALQSLKNALENTFNSIIGTTTSTAMQYMSAQSALSAALQQARGGTLPTLESLQGTLSTLSGNTSSRYATLADFQRDQLYTAGMIDELAGYTDQQLSVEESMLSELQRQTEILNTLGFAGIAQIDGSHANGLDYVPTDGYTAKLHRGEMVVPAGQADYLRTGQMAQELRGLRMELSQIRLQGQETGDKLVKYAKDSNDVIERWEVVGLPETRV